MSHFKINENDIFFILKDQLKYESLCDLPRYCEFDGETLDMTVTEAIKFAKEVVAPLQEIGETWGVVFENNQVRCAPEFREVFKIYGRNGWTAAARDPGYGGQGFPRMFRILINDYMYGAAQAFNMAPSLTHGAAHLIESFASQALKERFVPKMYGGQWAGTMALTESNAGSNLAAIRTMAVPEGDHFKIKGTKIFISWGDHDLTENIVHLILARTKGAPEGIKGISLFIVPKIRVNADGSLGEANDVICTSVEEKLGLHASPTCALNFGDNDACEGYLCGEENKGLAHMFQMMNQARINSGVSGMTLASSAYHNALAYAKERTQGSDLARKKPGQVPIITHPDVRRMLLWMKAMVDGMRSMIYTAALWSDFAVEMPDKDGKQYYENLLDFFTPIIKAYCSDMGFRVCETAIQCMGGYGYCKDYHLEQYLRDIKILSLYEGTNGIQSMDLLGRKMRINDGAPFKAFMNEISIFCNKNLSSHTMGKYIKRLYQAIQRLSEVAIELSSILKSDPLQWASSTYPALLCFGDVALTWRLLDMALIAEKCMERNEKKDFYIGKLIQAKYFTEVTLPITMARMETCLRKGREIIEIPDRAF
jgi:3-(methylthio)propanoyl-CoA dehydrogenase